MNYKGYITRKAASLVEVISTGGGYAFSEKQYDPLTGELINPVIEAVDLAMLNARKTELEDEVTDIDQIIVDIGLL